MQNTLLRRRSPNDQFPMTNWWHRSIGIWSLVTYHSFVPALAWAHGDDDLTALSFLGPLILVAVLAFGLSVGRPLVRWFARRG